MAHIEVKERYGFYFFTFCSMGLIPGNKETISGILSKADMKKLIKYVRQLVGVRK